MKLISKILTLLLLLPFAAHGAGAPEHQGPVLLITIDGSINPATDDFLKTTMRKAALLDALLVVIRLNTPGGLVTSMQSMVQTMLDSEYPIAVYVSPAGASAASAGVFITMAAHFAAMAPGTTIGAAHPVFGTGQDLSGDMRAKIENHAVSLVKAIAEQRGRNVKWAEQAVRESVSITDRDAVAEKVVDFAAGDLQQLLAELNAKTVAVKGGRTVTLRDLPAAPRQEVGMSLKQIVVNILSDPNIAILLGLGAMLGIGIELYHPGAMLPGIVGVICLVLSLTSAQVLPINYGGFALLLLGGAFFVVELFMPTFGLWGGAGIVCLVLGAIYMIDTDQVWSVPGYGVDLSLVVSAALTVGALLMALSYLAVASKKSRVTTGQEGIVGAAGTVRTDFAADPEGNLVGKVQVGAEYWNARLVGGSKEALKGARVIVRAVEPRMVLAVEPVTTPPKAEG